MEGQEVTGNGKGSMGREVKGREGKEREGREGEGEGDGRWRERDGVGLNGMEGKERGR